MRSFRETFKGMQFSGDIYGCAGILGVHLRVRSFRETLKGVQFSGDI